MDSPIIPYLSDAPRAFTMLPQIRLDRDERRPLHAQLRDQLRAIILSGDLRPGDRLPPTRHAAMEFGVARNIVTLAYEELRLEGYLEARVGAGTWVSESLSDHLVPSAPSGGEAGEAITPQPARLSKRGQRIAAQRMGGARTGPPKAFRPGSVAAHLFPYRIWRQLTGRVSRSRTHELIPYGDAAGDVNLRSSIAEHLARSRGVRCHADQILVTSGSQHGLDLTARLLLDEGDRVAIEDPGYLGARAVFSAAGAKLVPVPVGEEGFDVSGVPAGALEGVRIFYTTSSHQYPMGMTMSLERRLGLLSEARRIGAWVVEDDYDCEFRYGARALPALQGLDREGRVIYVGTFSKVLAPGLRVGFLVLPESLIEAYQRSRAILDHHPPLVVQATLAEFFDEGHMDRHVTRLKHAYREVRDRLLEGLDAQLGSTFEVIPSVAGLHVCGLLADGVRDMDVSEAAARHGIEAPVLSDHYLGPRVRQGLVLGFGAVTPEEVRPAVSRLARAVEETI